MLRVRVVRRAVAVAPRAAAEVRDAAIASGRSVGGRAGAGGRRVQLEWNWGALSSLCRRRIPVS